MPPGVLNRAWSQGFQSRLFQQARALDCCHALGSALLQLAEFHQILPTPALASYSPYTCPRVRATNHRQLERWCQQFNNRGTLPWCLCVCVSSHRPHSFYSDSHPVHRDPALLIISSYNRKIHTCSVVADKPRQKRNKGNEEKRRETTREKQ